MPAPGDFSLVVGYPGRLLLELVIFGLAIAAVAGLGRPRLALGFRSGGRDPPRADLRPRPALARQQRVGYLNDTSTVWLVQSSSDALSAQVPVESALVPRL